MKCRFENDSVLPECSTHNRLAIDCMRELEDYADSLRVAYDILCKRTPTDKEWDAHEHMQGCGESFVPMGSHKGVRCPYCTSWKPVGKQCQFCHCGEP